MDCAERVKSFLKLIEEGKKKLNLTPEEMEKLRADATERYRLEELYNERFPNYPLAALHNMDLTDAEICEDLKKCLETNTDWWTLRGDVYRDDVIY